MRDLNEHTKKPYLYKQAIKSDTVNYKVTSPLKMSLLHSLAVKLRMCTFISFIKEFDFLKCEAFSIRTSILA